MIESFCAGVRACAPEPCTDQLHFHIRFLCGSLVQLMWNEVQDGSGEDLRLLVRILQSHDDLRATPVALRTSRHGDGIDAAAHDPAAHRELAAGSLRSSFLERSILHAK